jgi:hypothetical protein
MDFAEGHVYTLRADCPVCQHPQRIAIDTVLLGWLRGPKDGIALNASSWLAASYEDLSTREIVHHYRNHVNPAAARR